mmetsp:Transcript_15713/g.26495  ORF Transcript_15713/g.26495 Transcript_15713/m.26495 type:complete len:194 (-) Transcript_15713:9-590(-)
MGRGSLTMDEFYNGLVNQLGIGPSQDELELFFSRYDQDKDGKLKFTEFCNAFLPIDSNHCAMLNQRHSNHRSSQFAHQNPQRVFVPLTLLDFKELLRTHFRVEVQAEHLRQQLDQSPIFSLKNAFQVCDGNRRGEITVNELRFLIESQGLYISDKDALSLMDKFDRGKRGSVNQAEFIQEMVPRFKLSPKTNF